MKIKKAYIASIATLGIFMGLAAGGIALLIPPGHPEREAMIDDISKIAGSFGCEISSLPENLFAENGIYVCPGNSDQERVQLVDKVIQAIAEYLSQYTGSKGRRAGGILMLALPFAGSPLTVPMVWFASYILTEFLKDLLRGLPGRVVNSFSSMCGRTEADASVTTANNTQAESDVERADMPTLTAESPVVLQANETEEGTLAVGNADEELRDVPLQDSEVEMEEEIPVAVQESNRWQAYWERTKTSVASSAIRYLPKLSWFSRDNVAPESTVNLPANDGLANNQPSSP